jgi:hypothetical protein
LAKIKLKISQSAKIRPIGSPCSQSRVRQKDMEGPLQRLEDVLEQILPLVEIVTERKKNFPKSFPSPIRNFQGLLFLLLAAIILLLARRGTCHLNDIFPPKNWVEHNSVFGFQKQLFRPKYFFLLSSSSFQMKFDDAGAADSIKRSNI